MKKDKLSWIDRLKSCWFILVNGTVVGLPEYKTMRQKQQMDFCRKRQMEMDKCSRPRSYPKARGDCKYTDYFER